MNYFKTWHFKCSAHYNATSSITLSKVDNQCHDNMILMANSLFSKEYKLTPKTKISYILSPQSLIFMSQNIATLKVAIFCDIKIRQW